MGHTKLAVSLPDELAERLRQSAEAANTSRSQLVSAALRQFFYESESRMLQEQVAAALSEEAPTESDEREAWLALGRTQKRGRLTQDHDR